MGQEEESLGCLGLSCPWGPWHSPRGLRHYLQEPAQEEEARSPCLVRTCGLWLGCC